MKRRWPLVVALLLLLAACGQAPASGPSGPAPAAPQESAGGQGQPPPERMIVRNGRIELTVGDVSGAVESVTALTGRLGGVVLTSEMRAQDGAPLATLSLRVPSERYDEAM